MNREQMAQNRGTSSEIRRLENELKDTQVAFDIFQANCRDDFEAKLWCQIILTKVDKLC